MNPGSAVDGFCAGTANIWQVIGIVLLVFKIVIPLLIIIFGMLDLGKAVVAAKDDEIKKAVKSLAMRIVSGIIIFFIPTLVGLIFNLIQGFSETASDDYKICSSCVTNPWGACDAADAAWGIKEKAQ